MIGAKDIVVGVDGSDRALAALQVAVKLKKERDVLQLLMIHPRHTTLDVVLDPFNTIEISDRQHRESAMKKLTKYEAYLMQQEIDYEVVIDVTNDTVREAIVKYVTENQSHLLVLSNRGLSMIGRLIMGSVSEYCVSNSPCSVIVVPNQNS